MTLDALTNFYKQLTEEERRAHQTDFSARRIELEQEVAA